jgi:glycosyltransferase involved in cell wall biosynthesis
MAELIEDGKTGYLADPGNPTMLSAVLQRALSMSGDAARRMREDAQAHVASLFDSSVLTPRLVAVYSELVSHQRNAEAETPCC